MNLRELLDASLDDPVLFASEGCRVRLRRWQRRALTRVAARLARGDRHLRLHIRTCHGAGKTFLVGVLFLWWMLTRPLARGITTAPTQRAVDRLLWSEIRKLYRGSIFAGRVGRVMDSSEFRVDYSRGWFGLGIASDQPFNLEGHHSPTAAMLAIDEAKAVPSETWNSLQGLLDAPETLAAWISTPWTEDGRFYETDVRGGREIIRVVVTVDDLIDEGIESAIAAKADYLRQFGSEDSPEYQSRALARYISASPFGEMDAAALADCQSRPPTFSGRKIASLDVARGDEDDATHDESVIALAQGVDVVELIPFRSRDLVASARRLALEAKRFGARLLRPDANGLGAGPTDVLRDEGWPAELVDEFVAQSRPAERDRFDSRAAEAAWHFTQRVNRRECSLPADDELRRQCLQIQFVPRAGGRLGLEKRPKVGGRRAKSPDRFDACMMATAEDARAGMGLAGWLREEVEEHGEKETAA